MATLVLHALPTAVSVLMAQLAPLASQVISMMEASALYAMLQLVLLHAAEVQLPSLAPLATILVEPAA
jgi:hypothetical protein